MPMSQAKAPERLKGVMLTLVQWRIVQVSERVRVGVRE